MDGRVGRWPDNGWETMDDGEVTGSQRTHTRTTRQVEAGTTHACGPGILSHLLFSNCVLQQHIEHT